MYDPHDSAKPAPTSYSPKDVQVKHQPGHVQKKTVRFPKTKYDTLAPGPGSYRHQSNFGIYSPHDTMNKINSDVLLNISKSQKVLALSTNDGDRY